MRVRATAFVVLGLAVALSGCASADTDQEATGDDASGCVAGGSASEAVTVEGDFGSSPTVTFDFPIEVSSTERTVAIEGEGETVLNSDIVYIDFAVYNGTNGDEITTSGFAEGTAAPVSVSESAVLAGLAKSLECSVEGSRVVGVVPPGDMWGDSGQPELGVEGTDSLVIVADVVEVVLPPTPADWTEDVPEIGGTAELPEVVLPEGEIPSELKLAVLEEGDGEVVKRTQNVTLQYHGTSWDTDKVFDQSYDKDGPITSKANGFVPGFSGALVGQKVGSTVLVTIPPEQAYGTDEAAHELGNQSLLFLIEIISAEDAE